VNEEAPDLAEPIVAWRVWRVVSSGDGYLLGSVVKPTVWPSGEPLVAECLRARPLGWFRSRGRHSALEPACECGVYAAGLADIGPYLSDAAPAGGIGSVLGRVSLWGVVVECERGFRASHAYPACIYVPADVGDRRDDRQTIADGLSCYGVPVEFLTARRTGATRALG